MTAAIEFMKRKFSDLNESSNRDIYAHPMTAVDNTVVTKVWKSCKTIIFRANMADSGMHLG